MTTLATTSSLRDALTPEALTRARRRLLTVHPDPTRANTPTPGSLAAERPHGTYDDTRAGHDAFSRGVVEDYDHGNHHLARATICPADPGLVTRAALSALGLPDTDATMSIGGKPIVQ